MAQDLKNSYALLIGIGQRKDDPPALAVTAADASVLQQKLTEVCGFVKEQVVTVIGENSTRENIFLKLNALIDSTKLKKADLVIVYFSGHGYKKGDAYYLISHDTEKSDLEDTAIRGSEFASKLNAIRADKVVVFLDCCYSGAFTNADTETALIPFDEKSFLQHNTNRVIITSSDSTQTSSAGQPVSLFTYALIEGLYGKFQLNNNTVTIFDLAMFLRERTSGLSGGDQKPLLIVQKGYFTENFVLLDYSSSKPAEPPFDRGFLKDRNGKSINTEKPVIADSTYRQTFIWMQEIHVDITGNNNTVLNQQAGNIHNITNNYFGEKKISETPLINEEIIAPEVYVPVSIRIEKEKVVYDLGKFGARDNSRNEIFYTDADLHAEISNFFLKWAKTKQDDTNREIEFQILGKILSRFIDFENQILRKLDLSSPAGTIRPEQTAHIQVLLRITSEAGLLSGLPWEYLFSGEKEARSRLTGKIKDANEKYPAFFLSADKNERVHLIRQTNELSDVRPVPGSAVSIVVFNNNNSITDEEVKQRFEKLPQKEGQNHYKIHFCFERFKPEEFKVNFRRYIKDMIANGSITENYILHYIAETTSEQGALRIAFLGSDDQNPEKLYLLSAPQLADFFDKDLDGLELAKTPALIFLEADHSAKIFPDNNGLAFNVSKNNIPAVIGFQDEFDKTYCSIFIDAFYEAMSKGLDVAQATTHARQYLKFSVSAADNYKGLYQFGIPVLFISTVEPLRLFEKIKESSQKVQQAQPFFKYCPQCRVEGKNEKLQFYRTACQDPRHRGVKLETAADDKIITTDTPAGK